jgi:hypothetical protein
LRSKGGSRTRVYSLNLTQAKQDQGPLDSQVSQGTKQFGQRPKKSLATTITIFGDELHNNQNKSLNACSISPTELEQDQSSSSSSAGLSCGAGNI